MEYFVVAFRSRMHTVKFYEFLKNNGVFTEIVNTPKEAGVGCGLSVRFKKSNYFLVRQALARLSLGSFAGIFSVHVVAGKRIVKSI